MNPQCQECGRFVSIGKGETIEISVSKDMVDKGHPEKVYLCARHRDKIELLKTFPWYDGHKTV